MKKFFEWVRIRYTLFINADVAISLYQDHLEQQGVLNIWREAARKAKGKPTALPPAQPLDHDIRALSLYRQRCI